MPKPEMSPLAALYYGKNAEMAMKRFYKREEEKSKRHSFIDPASDKPCIIDMTSTYTRGKKVFFK